MRTWIIVLVMLGLSGCSMTVPFVQINIGKVNDVSNALLGGNKGPRVANERSTEVGEGATVVQSQPAEVMPELSENQEGALDALSNFQRAFKVNPDKGDSK